MADRAEYERRIPLVSWAESESVLLPWNELTAEEKSLNAGNAGSSVKVQRWRQKKVTEYYRLTFRNMLQGNNERTLVGAIIPKAVHMFTACNLPPLRNAWICWRPAPLQVRLFPIFMSNQLVGADLYGTWTALPLITSEMRDDMIVRISSQLPHEALRLAVGGQLFRELQSTAVVATQQSTPPPEVFPLSHSHWQQELRSSQGLRPPHGACGA